MNLTHWNSFIIRRKSRFVLYTLSFTTGRKQFCRHISTSECSLEMKLLIQSAVERWRCPHTHTLAYVTHTLAYGMHTLLIRSHTLLIRSHTLLIRYAYGDKRYSDGDLCCYTLTYVGKRYSYATHTPVIRYTKAVIRYSYVCNRPSSKALASTLKSCAYEQFFRNFHTQLIRSFIPCSVTAPLISGFRIPDVLSGNTLLQRTYKNKCNIFFRQTKIE